MSRLGQGDLGEVPVTALFALGFFFFGGGDSTIGMT